MKKRTIKLLRRLRIDEASLVDAGANQHSRVLLWKRHDPDSKASNDAFESDHHEDPPMSEPMPYGRADVAAAMMAHAECLYPAATPEQSLAKAVQDGDPLIRDLYRRHSALPVEVMKTGIAVQQTTGEADLRQSPGMDDAWRAIEEVAHGFMDRDLSMTKPQAIALACTRRGDLYQAYNQAQSAASFAQNQKSGTRREL